MKILFLNSYGIAVGGTETSLIEIKAELEKSGHTVRVFTSDVSGNKNLFSDYVYKYPKSGFIMKILFRLFNIYAYIKLKKVLKLYQPDIVHLHRMDLLSPSVLFALKNYPTVLTIHGPEDFIKNLLIWFMPYTFFKNGTISEKNLTLKGKFHYYFHSILQYPIYKYALKNVNLFISPSKHFSKLLDVNIKPVKTVQNGIKLLQAKKRNKLNYRLLYLGRLDKFKGIEFAIFAMPIILKEYPKTILTIVGEGNYKNQLIKYVKKLKLEKNVQFIPWQKTETINKNYENANIILMPSIWPESFGKVGVEAMSVGRPVIASHVGGIPEWLIDGKTGYLVEPGNPYILADKVIKLFRDTNLLLQMSLDACNHAKLFSVKQQSQKIEQIYKTLIINH